MKRIVTIAVSLAILAVIYWKVDIRNVIAVLTAAGRGWILLGMAAFVPLIWLAGVRLCRMVPRQAPLAVGEAIRLNLAAAVLNMVLPSKMGDLAKSWFFRQRGHLSGSLALSLVVFERICDMLSLLLWCAAGLLFVGGDDPVIAALAVAVFGGIGAGMLILGVPRIAHGAFGFVSRFSSGQVKEKIGRLGESWAAMHSHFWLDRRRLLGIAVMSVTIWFVNLVQVWFFLRAVGGRTPLLDSLGLIPLAILAGLLPLTFAGVGTRDAAVIYLFRDWLSPEAGAALGVLLTLRYVVMGLLGLPYLGTVSRPEASGGLRME